MKSIFEVDATEKQVSALGDYITSVYCTLVIMYKMVGPALTTGLRGALPADNMCELAVLTAECSAF